MHHSNLTGQWRTENANANANPNGKVKKERKRVTLERQMGWKMVLVKGKVNIVTEILIFSILSTYCLCLMWTLSI